MAGDAGVPASGLDDTQATLRQIEGVLGDFDRAGAHLEEVDRVIDGLEARPTGLKELVSILVKTYAEIMGVIDSLRKSRGLLEAAAMERLKSTHEKLAEVSSATEVAATGMLDGLDRALVLVDHIEVGVANSDSDESSAHRDELRDELHTLMNLLQFQDITAQQLGYASTVLQDIEDRMVRLADVFDLRDMGLEEMGLEGISAAFSSEVVGAEEPGTEPDEDPEVTNDPEASTLNAEGRQAVADEIFT